MAFGFIRGAFAMLRKLLTSRKCYGKLNIVEPAGFPP